MAARNRRGPKHGEAHVRLHAHELNCPAYRTLTPDARALLVEFRALYKGRENRVFFSVRQMMERLGIGQRRAQQARDALLERGWIYVIEKGAFHRKNRYATVYALTNEPLECGDGATAPKDFMRWTPSQKFTVAAPHTNSSHDDYRAAAEPLQKVADSIRHDYRNASALADTVAATATQISYQAGSRPHGKRLSTTKARLAR